MVKNLTNYVNFIEDFNKILLENKMWVDVSRLLGLTPSRQVNEYKQKDLPTRLCVRLQVFPM